MDKIRSQRKAILGVLIGVAIFSHGFVINNILNSLSVSTDWMKFLKIILTGGTLYSFIILGPIWLYDKYLWKIINPEYNFEGTWIVKLYKMFPLNEKHIKSAGFEAIKPYSEMLTENAGEALIRQTPFRLFVQEASGFSQVTQNANISTWNAEIICVNLPGKINVVFDAVPNGDVFSGRDSLTVVSRDSRGRPLILEGNAYHVIPHLDITLKGAIRYERKINTPANNV